MKTLAIFDLDGTIQDSSMVIVGSVNHVRKALGLEPMDEENIIENINNISINQAEFFYNSKSFSPTHHNLFVEFYNQNQDKLIRVYEGIDILLKELKAKGCTLAIATNAYRSVTLKSLKALGILELFDEVVCGDDVVEAKPSAQMLNKILKSLGKTPQEAIFIGDGERDLIASKRANIDFLLVNWGFNSYKNAINSVDELKSKLNRVCFDL
jgi:phosphoglycolate phosphatase